MPRVLTTDKPSNAILELLTTSQNVARPLALDIAQLLPGAPIYDVMAAPFNAAGNGIADDTLALNAAIAAANAVPGTIYLGPAHRITAALATITGDAVQVQGRGIFGTQVIDDSAAGVDVFTLANRYGALRDVWIRGFWVRAIGHGVRVVPGGFRVRLERLLITQKAFGVEHVGVTLSDCQQLFLEDLYGSYGFRARGTSLAVQNQAIFYTKCVAGTGYPQAPVGTLLDWAPATAKVPGNVVRANGALWQCNGAGVTAAVGTGPSGFPAIGTNEVHTTPVIDGTVSWLYAMPDNDWFVQDSFGGTFEIRDCGTLQGGRGLAVRDSTPGPGSVPTFIRASNLEVDHSADGVLLAAGASLHFSELLVISTLGGNGFTVGAGVSGVWSIEGGEIFGSPFAGISVAKGDGSILGVQIGACSVNAANTRDGVEVGAGVTDFTIADCTSGDLSGTGSQARYGISIGAGCDRYVVANNRCTGNDTGGILNTPGRSSTRVLLDNVPDVTISPGSVWGLAIDAAGANVPTETTPVQQGQNLRRETVVVDAVSAGVVATYAIASTTTQVQFKLAGALTINGMTASGATFGKRVVFSLDQGFAGSVTWNNDNAGAGSALERVRTPGGVPLTIFAGEEAEFEYYDSRWRCVAVAKRGLVKATIQIAVPNVAASTSAFVDTSLVGSALQDLFAVGDPVLVNPQQDVVAAGSGQLGLLSARISAANTLRCCFAGTAPGGNQNFTVTALPRA